MKKIVLLLGMLALFPAVKGHAEPFDFGGKVASSFSDVATNGPVMFASGTIRFVGAIISSGSSNGVIAIYRSTASVFTADLSTQTRINCSFSAINTNPNTVDFYGMENDSYTYVQRVGGCEATLFFTFPDYTRSNPTGYVVEFSSYTGPASPNNVGLPWNGLR